MLAPVEISARHFHSTEEDYRILFGDEDPKEIKSLSQKGQFASDKVVILQSANSEKHLEVRLLGPFRDKTQVEISQTDAYALKINPPVEEFNSGNGALVTLTGPNGKITKNLTIIAQRHLHIDPQTAEKLNIKDKQFISVKIGNKRSLILEKVLVRVNPKFVLSVHLDTDEGNAAGLIGESSGNLII